MAFYDEWKRKMDAKKHEMDAKDQLNNKIANFDAVVNDWTAENDKIKNAGGYKTLTEHIKAKNDAELARRASLYPTTRRANSTPDPNAAFRRKKAGKKESEPLSDFYDKTDKVANYVSKQFNAFKENGQKLDIPDDEDEE